MIAANDALMDEAFFKEEGTGKDAQSNSKNNAKWYISQLINNDKSQEACKLNDDSK